MSLVVVGISHRSSTIEMVERVVAGVEHPAAVRRDLCRGEDVSEAVLVATCNRVEVYAETSGFHGGLRHIGAVLSAASGLEMDELSAHLYVHYEDRGVAHLFTLACGLDSMAVGESQILGQVRSALVDAQRTGTAGSALNPLFQRALRVGKRAHRDTDLDHVSRSVVQVALERATEQLPELPRARALLVGAGAMAGLAAATLARAGIQQMTVVNRRLARAERLAQSHGARTLAWEDLGSALGDVDLIFTCTGAAEPVISRAMLESARGADQRPLVIVDLALPRDVDPDVTRLAGVHLWTLARLQRELAGTAADGPLAGPVAEGTVAPEPSPRAEGAVAAVQELITAEVAEYLTDQQRQELAPTLAALRSHAGAVMQTELARLDRRLPQLSPEQRSEVAGALHRVVDKLLHTPTVRVKELTQRPAQDSEEPTADYARVLRELFDLDPHEVAAVVRPPRTTGELP